jgi:undecaprenyl-diphosphatase
MNKIKQSKSTALFASILLLISSVVFTIAVAFLDVETNPEGGHNIGLSTINLAFHKSFPYNELLHNISEYAGYIPVLFALFFAVMGAGQALKHKSFKKVDNVLYFMAAYYVLVGFVYLIFEKLCINVRPVMLDGEWEASYPSSHTLFAITLCASTILANDLFFAKAKWRKIMNIAAYILMFAVPVMRLFSGVHWLSDIVGGVIISTALVSFLNYAFFYVRSSEKKDK